MSNTVIIHRQVLEDYLKKNLNDPFYVKHFEEFVSSAEEQINKIRETWFKEIQKIAMSSHGLMITSDTFDLDEDFCKIMTNLFRDRYNIEMKYSICGENFRNELLPSMKPANVRIVQFKWLPTNPYIYPNRIGVGKKNYTVNPEKHNEQFWKQALDKVATDCTFKVKEELIPAHKTILFMSSETVKALIENSAIMGNPKEIEIGDCTPWAFKEMLHFLYTGNFNHPKEAELFYLPDLYRLAHRYDIKDLCSYCEDLISEKLTNLDEESFPVIMDLAFVYDIQRLLLPCLKFANKNADRVNLDGCQGAYAKLLRLASKHSLEAIADRLEKEIMDRLK